MKRIILSNATTPLFVVLSLLPAFWGIAGPLQPARAQTAADKSAVRADASVTRRAALVIGNTVYQNGPLKNPVKDARDMGAVLAKLGFTVTLKNDLTLVQMRAAVNAWADTLDSHTLALVYYSGHGVAHEGQNYLVPTDNAAITHRRDVPELAYPFQRLLDATKEQGCPLRIFILDACRNNPLPTGDKGVTGAQTGLVIVKTPTSAFIAYSAGEGETASDGASGSNGLYTEALLKNIGTPGLPIEQVFKRVRGSVKQASASQQNPEERSQLIGEFYFAGGSANMSNAVVNNNARDLATRERLPKGLSVTEYIGRGDAFFSDGDFETAAQAYAAAIEADPRNAEAYRNRGNSFTSLKRYEAALADYTHALLLKPDDADAYQNRGYVHNMMKREKEAIADSTDALRLRPIFDAAYNNRGVAYANSGRHDLAIVDLSAAIRLKPNGADAYNNRGFSYVALNQIPRGIADYTEAIRIKPDSPIAYNNRGAAYVLLNNRDKAIADCTEAIRLQPEYADAYISRGNAYSIRSGEEDQAIADYTTALRIQPDFAVAFSNRASAYQRQGRFTEAIADFDEAIRLRPGEAQDYKGPGRNAGLFEAVREGHRRLR